MSELFIEQAKLGMKVKSLMSNKIVVLVKVLRGEGRYAYWECQGKFYVVASRKFRRLGCLPAGTFLSTYPRVKRSSPRYRFMEEI